ncbi:unnamed protein product [Agarophyton chilense]
MAASLAAPQLIIYDDFVIEAYCSIAHVPFATVSEQRGSAPKTSEQERKDGLYGRCRTCLAANRPGEQMLLCDSCDRAFHLGCIHPRLKDVPKGEWHCAKCTAEARFNCHTRAATVANFRNVLDDIATFPSLPLKLRVKMLDLYASTHRPPHRAPLANTPTACAPAPQSTPQTPLKTLPPKARSKRMRTAQKPAAKPAVQSCPSPNVAPAVPQQSSLFAEPARSIVRLSQHLQPVASMLGNQQAVRQVAVLNTHFTYQQQKQQNIAPANTNPPNTPKRTSVQSSACLQKPIPKTTGPPTAPINSENDTSTPNVTLPPIDDFMVVAVARNPKMVNPKVPVPTTLPNSIHVSARPPLSSHGVVLTPPHNKVQLT